MAKKLYLKNCEGGLGEVLDKNTLRGIPTMSDPRDCRRRDAHNGHRGHRCGVEPEKTENRGGNTFCLHEVRIPAARAKPEADGSRRILYTGRRAARVGHDVLYKMREENGDLKGVCIYDYHGNRTVGGRTGVYTGYPKKHPRACRQDTALHGNG